MSKPIDYNPHLGFKDDVIRENMGLVHHIANKFRGYINQSIGYEDIASEGSIGLIKAFEYFDPTKVEGGVKFSTYAVRMIQGYIQTFISVKGSSVKTPRGILRVISAIRKMDLWDAPATLISEKTGLQVGVIEEALHFLEIRGVASLDFQMNDENESSELMGLIPSFDDSTQIFVTEFIESLKERDQILIKMLMAGAKQHDISAELGLSQSFVSRLLMRIGKKYKKYLGIAESEEKKMNSEVTTRRINKDEAKRYGVASVMDKIEWFSSEVSFDISSVSLNSLGVHINRPGAKELGLSVGQYIQVGFNAELNRLVIRKADIGIKLNKTTGKTGAVATNNKRIGRWLESKNTVRKRYALQFDETAQVHFIQLEAAGREAGTA